MVPNAIVIFENATCRVTLVADPHTSTNRLMVDLSEGLQEKTEPCPPLNRREINGKMGPGGRMTTIRLPALKFPECRMTYDQFREAVKAAEAESTLTRRLEIRQSHTGIPVYNPATGNILKASIIGLGYEQFDVPWASESDMPSRAEFWRSLLTNNLPPEVVESCDELHGALVKLANPVHA